MDMNKLLQTMNAIEDGSHNGASKQESSEMKKILESFSKVEECGMPESMPEGMPTPEVDPVTMNVTLSARGSDAIADLIKLMGGATAPQDAMPSTTMPSTTISSDDSDMEDMRRMIALSSDDKPQDEGDVDEEWDNSPEEDYKDTDYMIKDLSGGLNRQKKAYAKAQDGDNAMAVESIKDRLWAALTEKKAKPDFLDVDKDGDKKEPMKKALKDKKVGEGRGRGKKKTKEEMTAEGRGKVMAGRGRGKDKLMAGRGRGKKK